MGNDAGLLELCILLLNLFPNKVNIRKYFLYLKTNTLPMNTKKMFLLLLAFGTTLSVSAESIPTPILYHLSKKILTETQHFMDNGENPKSVKVKIQKSKPSVCPLKCQPKKEQKIIKSPALFGLGTSENLWKTESENAG